MADRAWLTVFATLAEVFIVSQPYEVRGAFMLLSSIDDTSKGVELRDSFNASHRHLLAALDGKWEHLEAARASMIRLAAELGRLRQTEA